ncbi:extracellular solute-binding protein [Aliisedimentitalea scapharcae]|uniref:Extracellular solute-binding protein n=1 Tax=Aliisedimentitalea scapharcae TaxID=1524259 RepID=A0ABZ2XZ99_9RHOB
MLKILGWAGYDAGLQTAFDSFRQDTGISVSFQGVRNQDDMHALAQKQAFDIACPTTDRLVSWLNSGLIAALDDARIGYDRIDPAFHADAHTIIDGNRMGSPNIWGGAGVGIHRDHVPPGADTLCLIDLFDPVHAGRLAMREDTAFVAAGRALEAAGKLPFPFDDSYRSEARMIANYDVIGAFLTDRAHHVARFWFSEEEGTDAFRSGDCLIGYSWDSTMAQLYRENLPYRFVAPIEGANCYLQNFVLGATADAGLGQDWIAWVNTPKGSALYASALGVNPCAKGAADLMPGDMRAFFRASYPPEALTRLWWQPEQPVWFVRNRGDYARRYRAAARQ